MRRTAEKQLLPTIGEKIFGRVAKTLHSSADGASAVSDGDDTGGADGMTAASHEGSSFRLAVGGKTYGATYKGFRNGSLLFDEFDL